MFCTIAFGQVSYTVSYFDDVGNPGGLYSGVDQETSGWTEILPPSLSSNTWSGVEAIPFAFDFYDQTVTHFKVSANGILTFDTTAVGLGGDNANLPSGDLPDLSVACFWDAFTFNPPTGSNDRVYVKTFGSAPNRQFWIKWQSFEIGSYTYGYMSVVLEEGTNRVYVVDMASSGISSGMTVGVQENVGSAVQYGDANLALSGGALSNSDNDYYMFEPFVLYPVNLGVASIDDPMGEDCGFGAAAGVTVTLENVGLNGVDFGATAATIALYVDGGLVLSEMLSTGLLGAGQTQAYTFGGTIDLSVVGVYNLSAVIGVGGDGNAANDTASSVVEVLSIVNSFPYHEDFEGGDGGWRSEGTLSSWALGIPSGSVISGAASGSNAWITGLSTGYNNSEDSWVLGPCFDLSSLVSPRISMSIWWDSEDSWDGAVLQSSIDGGNTWQNVGGLGDPDNWFNDGTIDGDPGGQSIGWSGTGSSGSGSWVTAVHGLDGLGGQSSVLLRIAFGSDGSINSYDGFAFDDIMIQDAPAVDVYPMAFVSPVNGGCADGGTFVELAVVNGGETVVSSFSAGYSVDGGAFETESFSVNLAAGDTGVVSFSTLADLSAGGSILLNGFVSMMGDEVGGNDSLEQGIFLAPVVTTFPYAENFEDGGMLDGLWFQGVDENQDWLVWIDSTGTSMTGPSGDHTTGSGYYVYMEDSGEDHYPVDLYSPCFDLSGMTNPSFSFWYHSYMGDTNGVANTLYIEVYSNGAWTRVDSIGAEVDDWQEWEMPLASFMGSGPIRVRLRGRTDNLDFAHDIAVDDFRVGEPLAVDLALTEILAPSEAACFSGSESVSIRIVNEGVQAIDFGATPAVFEVLVNAGSQLVRDSLEVGILGVDSSMVFNFSPTIDLSISGIYPLAVSVTLAGDGASVNDSLSIAVLAKELIEVYPYIEDFEGGAGSWTVGGSQASWELGTPNGALIQSASSGTHAWVTDLDGGYADGERSWVVGPCFDFSNLVAPRVSMAVWWDCETNFDGAVLESSIDGGGSWQAVGAFGDPNNWYTGDAVSGLGGEGWTGSYSAGSGNWVIADHRLDGLGGEGSVLLRVLFGSDASVSIFDGFAFDDFVVYESPSVDLAVLDIVLPEEVVCPDSAVSVRLQLANMGTMPAYDYTLGYSLDGGAAVTELFTRDTLEVGDTVLIDLSMPLDLSTSGGYVLSGLVSIAGDGFAFNDVFTKGIEVLPMISSYPYVEDFEDGGLLDSNWRQDGGDSDQDWTVYSGATPTIGTGPSVDGSGNASGYYVYVEDSGFEHEPVNLLSPCFDLTGMLSPRLFFDYHSNDTDAGANENLLHIDVYANGGWILDVIPPIGHVDTMWHEGEVPLLGLSDMVRVRFRGSSDNGAFTHDVAIDNVIVLDFAHHDLAVNEVIISEEAICESDMQMFEVVVANVGAYMETGYSLDVYVYNLDTVTYSYSFSDSLDVWEMDTVWVGPIDLTGAIYKGLLVVGRLGSDIRGENDSLIAGVAIRPVTEDVVVSDTMFCDPTTMVTLAASANHTVHWYTSQQSLAPIWTGNTLVIDSVNHGETYYVGQEEFEYTSVGAVDTTQGAVGVSNFYFSGLAFEVIQTDPVVLDTVTCYVESAGDLVVNISDEEGIVVGSTVYTVSNALFMATGGEVDVPVGISLLPGSYTIDAAGSTVSGLLRNTSGASYPYISSRIMIRDVVGGISGQYNYFYDWRISAAKCESYRMPLSVFVARDVFEPNDVVAVDLPVIGTQHNAYICDAGDIDLFEVWVSLDEPNMRITLSGATDEVWVYLKDVFSGMVVDSGMTDGVTLEMVANGLSGGTYVLEVRGGDGYSASDSYNLRVQKSSTPFGIRTDVEESALLQSLLVYPNPNEGDLYVKLSSDVVTLADITVVDVYGKEVYRIQEQVMVGENLVSLRLPEVASGLYLLKIQVDDQEVVKRIQVER